MTTARGVEGTVNDVVLTINPYPSSTVDDMLINDLGHNSLLLVELTLTLEDLFALVPTAVEDAPPLGSVREPQEYFTAKVTAGEVFPPDADLMRELPRARRP